MRIIGGKDYYDSGLSYGIDSSIVFVRKGYSLYNPSMWRDISHSLPKISPRDKAEPSGYNWRTSSTAFEWKFDNLEYHAEPVSVFFCGKIYKGIRVFWRSLTPFRNMDMTGGKPAKRRWLEGRQETFWDLNAFNKWGAKNGVHIDPSKQHSRWGRGYYFRKESLTSERLTPYIENGIVVATWYPEQEKVKVRDKHISMDSEKDAWWCNSDNLKDFDFIRLMDPVKAFQEISMWVGGVIPNPGNKTVEIQDDAIKLAKHGMDKHSFRKLPEKAK